MNGHLNLLHYITIFMASQWKRQHPGQTFDLVHHLDGRDNKGHTAMAWAAYKGHADIVRYLLAQRADLSIADQAGMTPLHWAAQKGHEECVMVLVVEGDASIHVRDSSGLTPEQHASRKNHWKIVNFLTLANQEPVSRASKMTPFVKNLWLFAPAVFTLFVVFTATNCGFWSALVMWGLGFLGLRFSLGKYWPHHTGNNKFYVGIFYALFLFSAMFYFYHILPLTLEHSMRHVLFCSLSFFIFGLYSYLIQADPGTMKPATPSDRAREDAEFASDLERGKEVKLCSTCIVRKPVRGKHCRTCDHCVAKFDHHCYWLDTCVGVDNHRMFGLLLIVVAPMHSTFAFLLSDYIGLLPESSTFAFPYYEAVMQAYTISPVATLLVIFHLFSAGWQFYMLFTQLRNITAGMTYNEIVNVMHYRYLWKDNRLANPFDRGAANNFVDFVQAPAINYKRFFYLEDGPAPAAPDSSVV
jgi:palmitoyltransferase ZDHHC13/17